MAQGRVAVAQLGARMHYAVPRIFEEAGLLTRLYTDLVANKDWPVLARRFWPERFRPAGLKRLLGRQPRGIPREKITTFPGLGLEFFRRRRRAVAMADHLDCAIWAGKEFCRRIIASSLDGVQVLYAFNTESLEVLQEARRRGIRTILEQTNAPSPIITRILSEESRLHPDLVFHPEVGGVWREWADRERGEWEAADLIVCGSQFVKDGIAELGGPVDRVLVVPYGVEEVANPPPRPRPGFADEFHVIFVGWVDLRKGAHYLIEAARALEGEGVRVRFVGPVYLSEEAQRRLPGNVELTGRVSRAEMAALYAWADAFCLPSLCEGSATVTYEAMAMGLPVIATHNTGSIVREGVNGFIVPLRDSAAIVEAIARCRRRLAEPGGRFPDNAGEPPAYSLAAYRDRLLAAVGR